MFGRIQEGQVHIFNGKMGAGKTTNGARELLDFHKRKMPVWVNFPVRSYPEIGKKKHAPIWFEDDLSGILAMEGGLYVIDEAYLSLNSRKWKDLPDKVFTAFRHVRKLHMTVIVLSQSWGDIDISVKRIASSVRMFEGGKWFGTVYPYTEYAIDENGEIIKSEPVEYISAVKGFRLIGRKTYNIFDTDFLFDSLREKRTWKSAVIENPNLCEPSSIKPSLLSSSSPLG